MSSSRVLGKKDRADQILMGIPVDSDDEEELNEEEEEEEEDLPVEDGDLS